MDDAFSGIAVLLLLLIGFAAFITLVASWKLLKFGWQLLTRLYEVVKPHIIAAWEDWQRSKIDTQKPDDIQVIGIGARDEIDEIMAHYRQQVDTILQTEGISPEKYPEVILLNDKDYSRHQEDTYAR